jgi:hypothetical protein
MSALAVVALSAALSTLPTVAPPTPVVPEPNPSLIQLCAATSIEAVDDLLADVDDDLLDRLGGLISLGVPETADPSVNASVQLAEVREALNCDALSDDTITPAPTPTVTPAPTTLPGVPDDDGDGSDSDGGDITLPVGGVDTGDGSTGRGDNSALDTTGAVLALGGLAMLARVLRRKLAS